MSDFHEALTSPENWGGVTDPAFHDATSFRYLVHALNPAGGMTAAMNLKMDAENGVVGDENWGDQKVNLYDEPERLGERVALSTSLIDQSHKGTWGEAGLIIGAAPANIVVTSPQDNGTNNNNLTQVLAQAARQPKLTGDSLLAQTSPTQYNEVVAVCKQGTHPLELKGFFVKTSPSGEPLSRQLADQMRDHARRLGLPLVNIAADAYYATDRVDIREDGKLAVEYQGSRYLLDGYEGSQFTAYDEMMRPSFPSPAEVQSALEFGVGSGAITAEQAEQVFANYAEHDRMRQTPTARFGEDGSVQGVFYKTGYGKYEDEILISVGGYGSRINRAKQVEAVKSIGLSASGRESNDSFQTGTVSPYEADNMVSKACEQLDETAAQRVRDWYAACRGNIERQWSFHQQSQRRLGGYGIAGSEYGGQLLFSKRY